MTTEDADYVNRRRPIAGQFAIDSLVDNVKAHLYARTWDGVGYWRYQRGRKRNYRVFFRFNRFNVPVKVPESDWPEGWSPLKPIEISPAPVSRPIIPNVPDVSADLEAFAARLMMALKTHLALPDEIRAMMRVRVYGLETISESGDWPRGIDTRWRPSRAQREDSEVVLVWFALLPKDLQEICWLRAKGFSIRAIAEFPEFKKGKSHAANASKVRALYGAAIVECFRNSKSAWTGSVEGTSGGARCA